MPEQDRVVEFLKTSQGLAGEQPAEVIQTHGAFVFLSGKEALKIKRAVRYDYLDYSTLAQREAALRRELELNAPAAPTLYRDVVPVTRAPDGSLALNGKGEVVEWVLRMVRFPDQAQLDRLAERGELDRMVAETLGDSIARYHAAAPSHAGADGTRRIADILDELDREFATMTSDLPEAAVARFFGRARTALDRQSDLLDRRAAAGHVRRCHGDLHLRNIVLLDGVPVPFDALEFSEELGTCDVLYDLAFLLMDLRHRGLRAAANAVMNRYLFSAGDEAHYAGLAALPLFQAVRAAISAMVAVQTSRAQGGVAALLEDAARYLSDASAMLDLAPAQLVAVGGLSGTGKTTVARALAPDLGVAPGAVHLRSDMIRKVLCGVDPLTPLGDDSYTPEVSARVYQTLDRLARDTLAAGYSVIVDAVFLAPDQRSDMARLAARSGAEFAGIWLEAPEDELLRRVDGREKDASDADARVVRMQGARDAGDIGWMRVDASGSPADTLARSRAALGLVPVAEAEGARA